MPREFDIGGQGIDTQFERDIIGYRPKIEYEKENLLYRTGLSADTAGQDILESVYDIPTKVLWEEIAEIEEELSRLEDTLSKKLKDIKIQMPLTMQGVVRAAANELGYELQDESTLPFELYSLSFAPVEYIDEEGMRQFQPRHTDNLSPNIFSMRQFFEDYMSDVNGYLNAELYTDVMEIKEDWNETMEFIRRGLLSQVIEYNRIPFAMDSNHPVLEEIHQKELLMGEEYVLLKKIEEVSQKTYMAFSSSDYQSGAYLEAVKNYDEIKQQVVDAEKKLFTRAETVDLVKRKASDTRDNLELIGSSVDFDPYEDEKTAVIYGLLGQFESKESMVEGLEKLEAVLKLSVDGKKLESGHISDELRGYSGIRVKQKINRSLVNGIHVRNAVYRDVYRMMATLDGVPSSANFEMLMNHVSEGMEETENMYRRQASDFYKLHTVDAEMRRRHVVGLINKDASRASFNLIRKLRGYGESTSSSWLGSRGLSSWVSDFLENK